jgi:hypothetical protein
MKNIKTTLFGVASVAVYVASFFFPEYKGFSEGLIAVLVAGGFIAAGDAKEK